MLTHGCDFGLRVNLDRKVTDAAIIEGKNLRQPYSNKLNSAK